MRSIQNVFYRRGPATALAVVLSLAFVAVAMAKPLMRPGSLVTEGECASFSQTGGGRGDAVYSAELGCWVAGGVGSEPNGDSTLISTITVRGHGGVSLNYQIQTTDVAFFDYLNISLETSAGTVPLVTQYNPNPGLFTEFLGPVESLSVDLSAYKGQTVTLVISAHQDGFGDQFQTLISNLTTFGLDE